MSAISSSRAERDEYLRDLKRRNPTIAMTRTVAQPSRRCACAGGEQVLPACEAPGHRPTTERKD